MQLYSNLQVISSSFRPVAVALSHLVWREVMCLGIHPLSFSLCCLAIFKVNCIITDHLGFLPNPLLDLLNRS